MPSNFTILSNNCATMAPKVKEIASWEADIIALQETKLGSLAQLKVGAKMKEANWQTYFGKAMATTATKNKVATASNAANGGVAIATKTATPSKKPNGNPETAILRDQGRWEEVMQALGHGDKHLKVASMYGYDGATGDGERFRLNEDLINIASIRLLEAGGTPYVLCGDFNINPQQSPAIAGLISKGLVVDVPAAFGLEGQHTFSHHRDGPPLEGVEGKGRTRIDTILANKAAFRLIKGCRIRWDLLLSDHAPIGITMDVKRYGAKIRTPNLPHSFPEMKWTAKHRKGKEKERDEAWQKAWSEVSRKFDNAEQRQDVEQMHKLWCKATVQMLKEITNTQGQANYKHAEKRANTANMCEKMVQSPTNKEGDPTTNRCRRMNKLAARLRELHNQLITNDKYVAEGRKVSQDAELQRQHLWTNITKDAVEDTPYTQWLGQGRWRNATMPSTKTVEKLALIAKKRAEENERGRPGTKESCQRENAR